MSLIYKLPNLINDEDSKSFPWPINMSITYSELDMPAEWVKQSAILLSWPHEGTDWSYMLDEVIDCYKRIVRSIILTENVIIISPNIDSVKRVLYDIDISKVKFIEMDTNDTWTRDFGAISVYQHNKWQILDFKFNGWGLKFASNYDNLVTAEMNLKKVFSAEYVNQLSFVLEGGSIESDGNGTILTTSECLLSANRNGAFTKSDIEEYLKWALGAKRVLWLNHGALEGDDTDSHIDTLARFVAEDTIAYVKCTDINDSHFTELKLMEADLMSFITKDNKPYKLIPLPMPSPIYDNNNCRLPATYANFLIMNGQVLVPTYNQTDNDNNAIEALQRVFLDRKVTGIDCNALIKQHGSLHCATMQFPKGVINE